MFASHPGATADLSAGTWTAYDALGRPISVSIDSEKGLLTSLTAYLDGGAVRSIDPRGNATTSRFQAFDGPGERVAIAHTHPVDNNFSGFPARITASGSFSRSPQGDLDVLYRFANNGYLATPNGNIIKFDYIGLRRAMRSGVVDLDATEFVSRVK